jgi:hypothetical protein
MYVAQILGPNISVVLKLGNLISLINTSKKTKLPKSGMKEETLLTTFQKLKGL